MRENGKFGHSVKAAAAFTAAGIALFAGCMTPERAIRETDEAGTRLATEAVAAVTGRTNAFSIARSADRGIAPTDPAAEPVPLSLVEALAIGAANDNGYQSKKEDIFLAALALDLSRHEFETTFAGLFSGGLSHKGQDDGGGRKSSSSAQGGAEASASRKLRNGATAMAALGLDIVKLFTGGGGRTLGFTGDASVTVPLLRGSGRRIVEEGLTQAERNLLYAVYEFEKYRQDYAVRIAQGYYGMLKVERQLVALRDNGDRLSANYRRAQMLYDSGRLSQVELDQTRQDVLATGNRIVEAEKARQSELDSFKITLGLPVEARISLRPEELERVAERMGFSIAETNDCERVAQPPLPWSEAAACELALSNRIDLVLTRMKLEDARRAVGLAEDALGGDVSLKLAANFGSEKASGAARTRADGVSATLSSDLPWERTRERNAYRAALTALDAAERSLENEEDSTCRQIRDDIRTINSAWSSFEIQREALEVARRRVRSTTLFQQAGRTGTRDLLDSEAALLAARNAVVAAIIDYRMAGLKLKRDMSGLELAEEGTIREE